MCLYMLSFSYCVCLNCPFSYFIFSPPLSLSLSLFPFFLSFILFCPSLLYPSSLSLTLSLYLFSSVFLSLPPPLPPSLSSISIDYKVDRDQVRRVEFTQGDSKYLILLIVTLLLILLIVTMIEFLQFL